MSFNGLAELIAAAEILRREDEQLRASPSTLSSQSVAPPSPTPAPVPALRKSQRIAKRMRDADDDENKENPVAKKPCLRQREKPRKQQEDDDDDDETTNKLKPFPCTVSGCLTRFSRKNEVDRHFQRTHEKFIPYYWCAFGYCDHTWYPIHYHNYADHLRSSKHGLTINFMCKECGSWWDTLKEQKTHVCIRPPTIYESPRPFLPEVLEKHRLQREKNFRENAPAKKLQTSAKKNIRQKAPRKAKAPKKPLTKRTAPTKTRTPSKKTTKRTVAKAKAVPSPATRANSISPANEITNHTRNTTNSVDPEYRTAIESAASVSSSSPYLALDTSAFIRGSFSDTLVRAKRDEHNEDEMNVCQQCPIEDYPIEISYCRSSSALSEPSRGYVYDYPSSQNTYTPAYGPESSGRYSYSEAGPSRSHGCATEYEDDSGQDACYCSLTHH